MLKYYINKNHFFIFYKYFNYSCICSHLSVKIVMGFYKNINFKKNNSMAKKSFKKIDFTDDEVGWMKRSLMDEADCLMMRAEKMIHCYNLVSNKQDLDGRL